ncbi:winged helix-turn-helix domain-containing protein [Candidatus Mycoplasma pogonae]
METRKTIRKLNHKEINIILVKAKNTNLKIYKQLINVVNENFKAKFIFVDYQNIATVKNLEVDFLIAHWSLELEDIFNWDFYWQMHGQNKDYYFLWIKDHQSENDFKLLKNSGDDIIYYDTSAAFFKWKVTSIFRRKWDEFSKQNTVIYRGLVIDYVKELVYLNGKLIKLSEKEYFVLSFLVKNTQKVYINKKDLYKKIWQTPYTDFSRSLDQILHRLKNKIGDEYFDKSKRGKIKIK